MKAHKAISLAVATVLIVGGVGTAVAFYPGSSTEKTVVKQTTSQQPQDEQAPTEEPTAPVETQQMPTEEVKPTVDQLKTIARQAVLDDGQNETQADCFEAAIDKRYGWDNVTEEFINQKFSELDGMYVAMCPALGKLFATVGGIEKAHDPNFVFPQDTLFPPGFKD